RSMSGGYMLPNPSTGMPTQFILPIQHLIWSTPGPRELTLLSPTTLPPAQQPSTTGFRWMHEWMILLARRMTSLVGSYHPSATVKYLVGQGVAAFSSGSLIRSSRQIPRIGETVLRL